MVLSRIERNRSYTYTLASDFMRTMLLVGAYWYCCKLLDDVIHVKELFDWMQSSDHSSLTVQQIYVEVRQLLIDMRSKSCVPFLLCSLGIFMMSASRVESVFSVAVMLVSSDVIAAAVSFLCAMVVTSLVGAVRHRIELIPVGDVSNAEVTDFLHTLHIGTRIVFTVLPYARTYLYGSMIWTSLTWVIRLLLAAIPFWSERKNRMPRQPVVYDVD